MGKLKVKKGVKKFSFITIILVLFLSIGIYSSIKIYKQKEYEKTYEYKLTQVGYSLDESKILLDKYKHKEIEYILNNELNNIYLDILNDKYFIYNNFYTYLDYLKENSDLSLRDIIEKVNTKTNYDYYTNTEKSDINQKELMLVNKYYYLDEDYAPENLVTIPTTYSWGEYGSKKINEDVYNSFLELWEDAHEEGYYLMISSAYRTYEKQQSVYDEYQKSRGTEYADSIAARPGFSEHQTGYSLDILEKNYPTQATFTASNAYLWLKDNAYKYGFILRYPEDKEEITGYAFESWHYRYVGYEIAKYIYENNITFDEYYAYFVK